MTKTDNKLLVVDDETSILQAIERLFIDHDLQILKATTGQEGLEHLRKEKIAVVLSDNHMPGMLGIEFLKHAKEISPDTSRVMMTAFADLKTAVTAINNCDIFRFIVKPWQAGEIESVVEESLNRHCLLSAMRKGDESILLSLAQTIELKDPYTRGHCTRVGQLSMELADKIGLHGERINEIKQGAWLHDCGKIGVPEHILNSGEKLTDDEFDVIEKHPVWGAEVARLANLSPTVINIILHHHENYDGSGYPHKLKGNDIPLEAAIVSIADTYDALTTDRPYQISTDKDMAIKEILSMAGKKFSPELCNAFTSMLRPKPFV